MITKQTHPTDESLIVYQNIGFVLVGHTDSKPGISNPNGLGLTDATPTSMWV